MNIIPRHIQRRFEQRWVAQFGSLGNPIRTKERRIEGLTGQRCAAARAKEKPAGLSPRVRSLPLRGEFVSTASLLPIERPRCPRQSHTELQVGTPEAFPRLGLQAIAVR